MRRYDRMRSQNDSVTINMRKKVDDTLDAFWDFIVSDKIPFLKENKVSHIILGLIGFAIVSIFLQKFL